MEYTLNGPFDARELNRLPGLKLSLYMPTHHTVMHRKKDILVFKNLAKDVITSLERLGDAKAWEPFIMKLKHLEDDIPLWDHALDGLSILATPDTMHVFTLMHSVEPQYYWGDLFHLRPLLRAYQERPLVLLVLEAETFAVYVYDHQKLTPFVFKPGIPLTRKEVLGTQHTENYQSPGSYGGRMVGTSFHGHGGKSDDLELDKEKYFRYVDRCMSENVLPQHAYPLVLMANKTHHALFFSLSNHPYLHREPLEGSSKMTMIEIGEKLRFHLQKELENLLEKDTMIFNDQTVKQSSNRQIDLIEAIQEGKLNRLWIEEEQSSKLPNHAGAIQLHTIGLIDVLIDAAFRHGTDVKVVAEGVIRHPLHILPIYRY